MSNQYIYNNYQQYSPNIPHSSLASNGNNNNNNNNGSNGGSINSNTSPTTANLSYISPPGSSNNSLLSSSTNSSTSTSGSSMVGGGQQQQASQQQQQHVGQLSSNYSFHTPRLRYYLSKSFDIEDDLEFCPEISESNYLNTSPTIKKFNPYTATVFSPSQENHNLNQQQQQQQQVHSHSHTPVFIPTSNSANSTGNPTSPRIHTPRIRKPLEIVNPQTKLRVGSPAIQNK
ncbi:hypothetical protein DFJ63DRAFT_315046 [Scheffersomyces coipomensis]|uniref:uncharacterized protein n=1 Tax=Scheffersomyces coipomensis TaxID=1788519 RepID=UPI00315CB5A5